jgi:hypothetical protein
MITARRAVLLVAFGVASLALAGCSDAPTAAAPTPAASRDVWHSLEGLVWCTPMTADSVTRVVGPAGGTITVGPHSLTVPAGALDSAVTITAVAPSDIVNRVVFQPSGLVFRVPATLTMSYANCGPIAQLLPIQVAYVDNLLQILYFVPSVDQRQSESVSGEVRHFSDYAVAW